MASDYAYITVANLEAFTGIDYSGGNAKYTDAIIEAQISTAEEIINTLTQDTFTGSVPNGVEAACKMMSAKLMRNLLIADGYGKEGELPDLKIIDELIMRLLQTEDDVSVSAIPMNGVDPSYTNRRRWF